MFTDMVPAPRPTGSDLQTGGTAAQYWIGTAKVKRGSHILLGRRSRNARDNRSLKLLSRKWPMAGSDVTPGLPGRHCPARRLGGQHKLRQCQDRRDAAAEGLGLSPHKDDLYCYRYREIQKIY